MNTTLVRVLPVPQLLVSNKEPTPEETVLIVEAIKAAEEEMNVRHSLPASKKDYRRDGELLAFVRSNKAITSTLRRRRIPIELLCAIFTQFANDPHPILTILRIDSDTSVVVGALSFYP